MKRELFLMLFAMTSFALPDGMSVKQLKEDGVCINATMFSYSVVRKVDKNLYLLEGNSDSPLAVLQTTHKIERPGPITLWLKYKNTKKLPPGLGDGFEQPVDGWVDCPDKNYGKTKIGRHLITP